LLAPLHHADTASRVTAERALNKHLNGGCQVPIACYAVLEGEQLWLRGLVGEPSGGKLLSAEARASRADAEALGVKVAEDLLSQGADDSQSGLWRGRSRVTAWRLLLTRPADDCAALAGCWPQKVFQQQPAACWTSSRCRSRQDTSGTGATGGLQRGDRGQQAGCAPALDLLDAHGLVVVDAVVQRRRGDRADSSRSRPRRSLSRRRR
jgi:hypothetical protein